MKKYIAQLIAVLCLQITGCAAIPSDFTNSVISVVLNQTPTIPKFKYVAVTNANYTIKTNDSSVLSFGLTTSRTYTLPLASSVPNGWKIEIGDADGSVSITKPIFFTTTGSDSINGGFGNYTIYGPGQKAVFTSDGINHWTVDLDKLAASANLADVSSPSVALFNIGGASSANPFFTGTVTVSSNGIAFPSGLQTAPGSTLVETVVSTVYSPLIVYLKNGTTTGNWMALRSTDSMYIPTKCWGFNPVFCGYGVCAAGWTNYISGIENPIPNALEVACTIADSTGRIYPITYNGQRMARLNPYGMLFPDRNSTVFNAGDYVSLRVFENKMTSNTNTYPNGETGLLSSVGQYVIGGNLPPSQSGTAYGIITDFTSPLSTLETAIDNVGNSTGVLAPGFGVAFRPTAVFGWVRPQDLNSVAVVGDSIVATVGDSYDAVNPDSGSGYFQRALSKSRAILNLGIPSDRVSYWLPTNSVGRATLRRALLGSPRKYKYVFLELGYNDLNAGQVSFSTMTNNYAQVVAEIYSLTGAKIIAQTISPYQLSASGKYYGPGDLSYGFATWTNGAAFNAFLLTNYSALGPIVGVFDFASAVETSPGSGLSRYLTNATYTGTCTTSNTVAFNSQYWLTLQDTNQTWITNALVGFPAQITNSSPYATNAIPPSMLIVSNTANTIYLKTIGVQGFNSPGYDPTNVIWVGSTYGIGNGPLTVDGSHPAPWFHRTQATNLLNANLFQ